MWSSLLQSQNRTRSPVTRSPWFLHDPVRPTRPPKRCGRNRFLLPLLEASRLRRSLAQRSLRQGPRAVLPGGSSHAVHEPVLAALFSDRVAPASCERKNSTSVVSRCERVPPDTGRVRYCRCRQPIRGSTFPFGGWIRKTLCWSRFFGPVRAACHLPATGSPSVRGPSCLQDAVRVETRVVGYRSRHRRSVLDFSRQRNRSDERREPLHVVRGMTRVRLRLGGASCPRFQSGVCRRAMSRCRLTPSAISR